MMPIDARDDVLPEYFRQAAKRVTYFPSDVLSETVSEISKPSKKAKVVYLPSDVLPEELLYYGIKLCQCILPSVQQREKYS